MYSCDTCGDLELTTAISSIASLIANSLDDDELALVGAMFTQLGDTLDTLAARRILCCRNCNKANNNMNNTITQ